MWHDMTSMYDMLRFYISCFFPFCWVRNSTFFGGADADLCFNAYLHNVLMYVVCEHAFRPNIATTQETSAYLRTCWSHLPFPNWCKLGSEYETKTTNWIKYRLIHTTGPVDGYDPLEKFPTCKYFSHPQKKVTKFTMTFEHWGTLRSISESTGACGKGPPGCFQHRDGLGVNGTNGIFIY